MHGSHLLGWVGAPLVALGLMCGATHAQDSSGVYLAARQAERAGDIQAAARLYAEAVANDPQNPLLLERAAIYAVSSGDIAGALPFARRLDQIAPDNRYAPLLFIVEDIRAGAFPSAIERIKASEAQLGELLATLIRGWGESVDDLALAEATFARLEGNDTLKVFGNYHLALAHAVNGDLEGAATRFANLGENFLTTDRRAILARAEIFAATGRQTEALSILAAVGPGAASRDFIALRQRIEAGEPVAFELVSSPTEGVAEALYNFASVLGTTAQNRNFSIILARLALHLRPDLVEGRILLAELLEQAEQFDLAIAAYSGVPPTAPQFLAAETGRANTLAQSGRIEEAIGVLTGLTRSHPEELIPHISLGDTLRREERFEECSVAYSAAVDLISELARRHWVLLYQRGICFERSDQWPKAEADFRKALELQPDQPLVLNYLGYSLVELRRNYEEAEAMIRSAVEQQPEDGYITDSLGWILYRLGRFEEAVEPMERAVSLVPFDPILNDHLGDVLWMVGRRMEARFQWKRALSFGPEEKDEVRIRRKLDVGLDAVLADEEASGTPGTVSDNDG